jgi:hypothetical protein
VFYLLLGGPLFGRSLSFVVSLLCWCSFGFGLLVLGFLLVIVIVLKTRKYTIYVLKQLGLKFYLSLLTRWCTLGLGLFLALGCIGSSSLLLRRCTLFLGRGLSFSVLFFVVIITILLKV